MSNKALIDADNPEWTEQDFRRAKPAAQLPADLAAFFPQDIHREKTVGL